MIEEQGPRRYVEAEKLYNEVLDIRQRLLGHDHPQVAASLLSLASLLGDQGRYEQAEKLAALALQQSEAALGTEHPQTVKCHMQLGGICADQGKLEAAETDYRAALQARQRQLGQHADTAESLMALAGVLKEQGSMAGKLDEAEQLSQQALDMLSSVLGNVHAHVVLSMQNLAAVLISQGKIARADALRREAGAIAQRVAGVEVPDAAVSALEALRRKAVPIQPNTYFNEP